MMDPVPRKDWKIVVPEPKLPAQLAIATTAIALGIGASWLFITYVLPHWPSWLFVNDAESDIQRWCWPLVVFLGVAIPAASGMFAVREIWWKRTHPEAVAQLINSRKD